MYLGLRPDPDHEVHAPPQHREMLRRIYEGCKLNGNFVDGERPASERTNPSRTSRSRPSARSPGSM